MQTTSQILEKRQISINRLSSKLESHGLKVLSVSGEGQVRHHIWKLRCEKGHVFENSGARLWTKEKCPHCYCSSMEEEVTRLLIESHYGKPFPNIRPSWLTSETDEVLELDMFNHDLKLAFEYNRLIHYKPLFGEEYLQKIQKKDLYKSEKCKELGIHLIHIKGIEKSSSKKNMVQKISSTLKEYGIFISNENQDFVIGCNIVKNTKHDCRTKINNILSQHNFTFVKGEDINQDSRFTAVHHCGKEYRFSLSHFRKNIKKGWVCSCQREISQDTECGIKKLHPHHIQRQEIAKKRAEFVGHLLCEKNQWIFSNIFQTKHKHMVFQYLENNELKTCSHQKFNKFITENNLNIESFQQQSTLIKHSML